MIFNISEGALVLFIALVLYVLAIVWYEVSEALDRWNKRRKKK